MSNIQPLIEIALTDREMENLKNASKQLDTMIMSARSDLDQHLSEQQDKQNQTAQIQKERKEIEDKFNLQEQLIARLEKQVPNIRNEKEFVASKKQLEEARKGRGQLEDQLLNLDINLEELQTMLSNLSEVISEQDVKYHKEADILIEQKLENESKIVQISETHDSLVSNLPTRIRRFYDKCGSNRIAQPICVIEDKCCSGCHMVLQPQLVNEMMVNPSTYRTCPHCSRILLYLPPDEEKTGAA